MRDKMTISEAYETIRETPEDVVLRAVYSAIPCRTASVTPNGNVWVDTRRDSYWLSPAQIIRVAQFL
jgi:hypothetical protein